MNRNHRNKNNHKKASKHHNKHSKNASNKPPQIFIGGCHPRMKRGDLKSYFSKFGQIKECRLMMDRKTRKFRGFAFISFKDPATTDKVLNVKGHAILGKEVELKPAMTKEKTRIKLFSEKNRKLFLFGLKKSLNKKNIEKYFSQYGKIVESRIYFEELKNNGYKGYGFILFDNESGMEKSLENGTTHTINGVTFDCKQSLLKNELEKMTKTQTRNMMGNSKNHHQGVSHSSHSSKKDSRPVEKIQQPRIEQIPARSPKEEDYVPKSQIQRSKQASIPVFKEENQPEEELVSENQHENSQGKFDDSENINHHHSEEQDEEDLQEREKFYKEQRRNGERNPGQYPPQYQGGKHPNHPPRYFPSQDMPPYKYRPPPSNYSRYSYYSHPYPPNPPPQYGYSQIDRRNYDQPPPPPAYPYQDQKSYYSNPSKKDPYYQQNTSSSSNSQHGNQPPRGYYNDPYMRPPQMPPHFDANRSAPYWNRPEGSNYKGYQQPRANSDHKFSGNEAPLQGFQPKRKMIEKTLSEYKGVAPRPKVPKGPHSEYPSSKPKIQKNSPPKKEQLSTYARDTEELFDRENNNTMKIFDLEDNDGLNAIFEAKGASNKESGGESVKHKTEGFALDKMKIGGKEINEIQGEIKPDRIPRERKTEVIQPSKKVFGEVKEESVEEDFEDLRDGDRRRTVEFGAPSGSEKGEDDEDYEDYEERRREITCLDFGL